MPGKYVTDLTVAAALDGTELMYVAQGAADRKLTTAALRNYARVGGVGMCKLVKDGANLRLLPYNGNLITIDSQSYAIPDAGIALAPTALTPGTDYYIYAYMNGAVMTLEASVTAHAMQTLTGVEIKSGASSRTLVGLARIITGPAWVDTESRRFVASWFNRRARSLLKYHSVSSEISSGTKVELDSSGRVEFLNWADETVMVGLSSIVWNDASGMSSVTSVALDDAAVYSGYDVPMYYVAGSLANGDAVVAQGIWSGVAEGYHYGNGFGYVNNGTGSWGINSPAHYPFTHGMIY